MHQVHQKNIRPNFPGTKLNNLDVYVQIHDYIQHSQDLELKQYLARLDPTQRTKVIGNIARKYGEDNLIMTAIKEENPDALPLLLDAVPVEKRYDFILSACNDDHGEVHLSKHIINAIFEAAPEKFLPIIFKKLPFEDCVKLLNLKINHGIDENEKSILSLIIEFYPNILPTIFEITPIDFHHQLIFSVGPQGLFSALIEEENIKVLADLTSKMTPQDHFDTLVAGGKQSAILYFIKNRPDLLQNFLGDARAPENLLKAMITAARHDLPSVLSYAAKKAPALLAPIFSHLAPEQISNAIFHLGGMPAILTYAVNDNIPLLDCFLERITEEQFTEVIEFLKDKPRGFQVAILIACTPNQRTTIFLEWDSSKFDNQDSNEIIIPENYRENFVATQSTAIHTEGAFHFTRNKYKHGCKSSNKFQPKKGIDYEYRRIDLASKDIGWCCEVNSLEERNKRFMISIAQNCDGLAYISRLWIQDHEGFAIVMGMGMVHTALAVGTASQDQLSGDMTTCSPEIFICDPWIKWYGPINQYPIALVRIMHKWEIKGKLIWSREGECWIKPTDKKWMRAILMGVRSFHIPVIGKKTQELIISQLSNFLEMTGEDIDEINKKLQLITEVKDLNNILVSGFHRAVGQAWKSPLLQQDKRFFAKVVAQYMKLLAAVLPRKFICNVINSLLATKSVLHMIASDSVAREAYSQLVNLIPESDRAHLLFSTPTDFNLFLQYLNQYPMVLSEHDNSTKAVGYQDFLRFLPKDKLCEFINKNIQKIISMVNTIGKTDEEVREAMLGVMKLDAIFNNSRNKEIFEKITGLYVYFGGTATTNRADRELLKEVPKDLRTSLLTQRLPFGKTVLSLTLNEPQLSADMILEYTTLLDLVGQPARATFVASHQQDIQFALANARQEKNTEKEAVILSMVKQNADYAVENHLPEADILTDLMK